MKFSGNRIDAVWRDLFVADRETVNVPTSLIEAKLIESLQTPSGLRAAILAAIEYLQTRGDECRESIEPSQNDAPNRKVVDVPVDEVRFGYLLEILRAIADDDTIIQMPIKETMGS